MQLAEWLCLPLFPGSPVPAHAADQPPTPARAVSRILPTKSSTMDTMDTMDTGGRGDGETGSVCGNQFIVLMPAQHSHGTVTAQPRHSHGTAGLFVLGTPTCMLGTLPG